jgi:hypothetical protein
MILAAAAHTRHIVYRFADSLAGPSRREVPHDASEARVFGGLRMATILEFKSAPRPTAASMLSACHADASAEIVLFPGVRYDRLPEEDASDAVKARRHREGPELED